jgi:DNA-directed RNA polymerase specialized sigma24 family protein
MPHTHPWPALLTTARRTLAGFHQIPRPVRDELAQETLLRTLRLGDQPLDRPRAFVRRVARNLAVDWLRRRRESALPDTETGHDRWQARTDARLDAQRVLRLLDRSPTYREVLSRCFLEELEVDDLVDAECAVDEPRHRVRDRIYKRRARGLAQARSLLVA